MTAFQRIVVFVLALSILNQSIDFDYVSFGHGANQQASEYDDLDSILELVLEQITGDNIFTQDNNDDSGMAHHKGVEKVSSIVYCDQVKKISLTTTTCISPSWMAGIDQSNKICKGYSEIIAPPPRPFSS